MDFPVQFVFEATDGPPHFSGWVEVKIEPSTLSIRWEGEVDWIEIPWWEVCSSYRLPNIPWREVLKDIKEETIEKAYSEGMELVGKQQNEYRASLQARIAELEKEVQELRYGVPGISLVKRRVVSVLSSGKSQHR